jgi:hypothetical protein
MVLSSVRVRVDDVLVTLAISARSPIRHNTDLAADT